MGTSSKWACLPLLLLALFISLASAARMFPLDRDDLDWLPVTGLKRKLSVTPSQLDADDDQSSVFTRMESTAMSNSHPDLKWLFEKGEGVMSNEDVGTKNVVDGKFDDGDGSRRHLSDKEIDELMDDLEDVGMDNSHSGFNDDECGTEKCGWSQNDADSGYGWGWNQGGGESGDSGSDGGGGNGNSGWGGGVDSNGGIRWHWGVGNIGGGGHIGGGGGNTDNGAGGGNTGSGSGGGSTGGIGWDWGIGNIRGGGNVGGDGGNGGGGGISIGDSGGSGRNSWHWGWHWGGGGASGMSTDIAPAPMSN